MNALAIALALGVGVLIGLRIKHHRFLTERQKRTDAEAKVDMYDRNALRTDHDVCGPAQTKPQFNDIDPEALPQARCDFNGPWRDDHLCIPRDDFDLDVQEGHVVFLTDDEGNECHGVVRAFHDGANAVIAEVNLLRETWVDAPDSPEWTDPFAGVALDPYQQVGEVPLETWNAWGSAIHADDDTSNTGPRSVPGPRVSD